MRRLFILIVACLFATAVWASNAKRIDELKARQQQIVVEIDQRQGIIQQQNAAIQQLNTEYVKLQGAIEELQRQDQEAAQKTEQKPSTKGK